MITAETRATFHHIYKMRWTVNWVILSMLVDGVNGYHLLSTELRASVVRRLLQQEPRLNEAGYDLTLVMGQSDGIHLPALFTTILSQLCEVPR